MAAGILQREIALPEGFSAAVGGCTVAIKGPKGEAVERFNERIISVRHDGNRLLLEGKKHGKKTNAVLTTTATHIENAIAGFSGDFVYNLSIVYSHFPINTSVKGDIVEIKNFIGEKNPRIARIIKGAAVEIKGKEIVVRSGNKYAAGQTAANLEQATRVRKKDRRVFQDGIFIVEKPTGVTKK